MKSPILFKKQEDLHKKYISCGQYINWNIEGLSILESEQAFIVQEVRIAVDPPNRYVEAVHILRLGKLKTERLADRKIRTAMICSE